MQRPGHTDNPLRWWSTGSRGAVGAPKLAHEPNLWGCPSFISGPSSTGTSGCLDVPSNAGAASLFGTPERARLRS
jgi:hypothetical protein